MSEPCISIKRQFVNELLINVQSKQQKRYLKKHEKTKQTHITITIIYNQRTNGPVNAHLISGSTVSTTRINVNLTLYPNRCLYIKVAKLRTGEGSAEMSHLPNCSVKIFKEHCRYFFKKNNNYKKNNNSKKKKDFFFNFHQLFTHHPLSADLV